MYVSAEPADPGKAIRIPRSMAAILTTLAVAFAGIAFAAPSQADPAWSSRGVPLAGQALFGAASVNPTQDPLPREAQLGASLGIHRTYWRGNQQEKAVNRATLDLQSGRIPWLSFKAPYAPGTATRLTWAEMAAGAGDAWAADLAQQLGSLPGPVWVAIHHNPESLRASEDVQNWKAMQQRLSPFFRAYPNIAYTVILTGYYQFRVGLQEPALSMEALWPGAQYVDVTGFNPYNRYGTLKPSGNLNTTFTEMKEYYTPMGIWSASVGGAKWGLAESGYTDKAAAKDANWLSRAYMDLKTAGGVAFTYWDGLTQSADESSIEPAGTWILDNPAKLSIFAQLLKGSDRFSSAGLPAPTPTQPGQPPLASPAPPVLATQPTAQISAKSDKRRSKIVVDVNPNKGKGYWKLSVQRKKANGIWVTYKKSYKTFGSRETRTLNLKKGTYRVYVNPKYGFQGAVSTTVTLKR